MAARQGLEPRTRGSGKDRRQVAEGPRRGKARRRGKCAGRGEERGLKLPLPEGRGAGARVSRCRRKGAPVLPVMAHMLRPSLLEHRGAKAWVAGTERATTQAP